MHERDGSSAGVMRFLRVGLVIAAACLLAAGCATVPPRSASTAIHRIDCPSVKHRRFYCGPAALSAVFKYYGVERGQGEIGKRIYSNPIVGTLKKDMVSYAREAGFDVAAGRSDLETVKGFVEGGAPVIALVTIGPRIFRLGHYVIVVGYDDAREVLLCHTGFEAYDELSYRNFARRWMRNWVMVIEPRSSPAGDKAERHP